ncbi:MAG: sodium:solute symporter family protein [Planctomycetota bacterium]
MHLLDWLIVAALLVGIVGVGIVTKLYTRGVADFLSANRCAGRYLLTMAEGLASFSAVAVVANFEKFYEAGFPAQWWSLILGPVALAIAVSGWIAYRFRETRALTMPQFLEMRYSKSFRVYAGIICWISGIMNYGIFPGVTAQLLINICDLPDALTIAGLSIPMFPMIMIFMLSLALTLTLSGGQIAVMVTDFLQAQFLYVVMLVLIGYLLWRFSWSDIVTGLMQAPEGESRLDPYKQTNVQDFNVWFFVMLGTLRVYTFMAWQGSQGYFSAAKSPHEAKMGRILGGWRTTTQLLLVTLLPIIAYAFLHHPEYAAEAATIEAQVAAIDNEQVQTQMRVPLTLQHLLPIGIMGLLVAILISAAVSTDDSYLHSWGSIFVQDVILPFKKKRLSPRQHLLLLRVAIFSMAVFAFLWSMYFPLNQYIFMYWQITGSVFTGGAGAAIIFGLYWNRGTTAAAWTVMIVGPVIAILSVLARTFWADIGFLHQFIDEFPLNGIQMAFVNACTCVTLYVLVALLTCRQPFNLQKMLHRGPYAIEGEHKTHNNRRSLAAKLFGIGAEFNRLDTVISVALVIKTLLLFALVLVGTALSVFVDFSESFWASFWFYFVIYMAVLSVITVIWFSIGGLCNLYELFKSLSQAKVNALDDGTVVGGHNLVDEAGESDQTGRESRHQ